MKKRAFIFLVILLLMLPTLAHAQIGNTTSLTYVLPDGTVEFDYPSTYTIDEQDGTFVTVFAPNGYWMNISGELSTTPITDPAGLARGLVENFATNAAQEFTTATVGQVVEFTLDDRPVATVNIVDGEVQLDYLVMHLEGDNLVYISAFGDIALFPEVEQELIGIIQSMRVPVATASSGGLGSSGSSGSSGGLGGSAQSGNTDSGGLSGPTSPDAQTGNTGGIGSGSTTGSGSTGGIGSGSTTGTDNSGGVTSNNPFNNAGFGPSGGQAEPLTQTYRRPDNWLIFSVPAGWTMEDRETYTLITIPNVTTTFGISGAPLSAELHGIEQFPLRRVEVWVEDIAEQYPNLVIDPIVEFEVNGQYSARADAVDTETGEVTSLIVVTIDQALEHYAFFTVVGDVKELASLEPTLQAILESIIPGKQ